MKAYLYRLASPSGPELDNWQERARRVEVMAQRVAGLLGVDGFRRPRRLSSREVYSPTMERGFLSVREAAASVNVTSSAIRGACISGGNAGGHQWRYVHARAGK